MVKLAQGFTRKHLESLMGVKLFPQNRLSPTELRVINTMTWLEVRGEDNPYVLVLVYRTIERIASWMEVKSSPLAEVSVFEKRCKKGMLNSVEIEISWMADRLEVAAYFELGLDMDSQRIADSYPHDKKRIEAARRLISISVPICAG